MAVEPKVIDSTAPTVASSAGVAPFDTSFAGRSRLDRVSAFRVGHFADSVTLLMGSLVKKRRKRMRKKKHKKMLRRTRHQSRK